MSHAIVIVAGFILLLSIPVGVVCVASAYGLRSAGKLTEVRLIWIGATAAFVITFAVLVNSMSDVQNLSIGGTILVEDGIITTRGYFSCLIRALLSTIVGVFIAQLSWRLMNKGVA